jgi:anti-anti-sigma factor
MATNPLQFPLSSSLRVEIEDLEENPIIVKCHGKLIRETSGELSQVVKPLLGRGKNIALDLEDVSQIDSGGFGALLALKASVVRFGLCSIELCRAGACVREMLRATHTLSAFDWAGRENPEESVLERRCELELDELRRNPDAKFAEVD